MSTIEDQKPKFMSIEQTEQLLSDQGYSFNEAGQSFNEIGVMFGGKYGGDGRKPVLSSIKNL